MSLAARADVIRSAHRHPSEGVPTPQQGKDRAALIHAAATNPALSDRAARIYALVVLRAPAELNTPDLAHDFGLTHRQVGQAMGELIAAGLVAKRKRVIGYTPDGRRERVIAYRLAGGAL